MVAVEFGTYIHAAFWIVLQYCNSEIIMEFEIWKFTGNYILLKRKVNVQNVFEIQKLDR